MGGRPAEDEGACGGLQRCGAGRVIRVRVCDQDVTDGAGNGIDETLDVPVICGAGIDDRPLLTGTHEIAVGTGTGHRAGVAGSEAMNVRRQTDGNTRLYARVAKNVGICVWRLAHAVMLAGRSMSSHSQSGGSLTRAAL